MPDQAAEIRAAGAVLWRHGPAGDEVAVIHRPRYDDWSFPKGKCDPGEHVLATAAREVTEETGIRIILGRRLGQARYEHLGRIKRVEYWTARAADPDASSGFVPNDEVDAVEWLSVAAAAGKLSYQRDVSLLSEFAGRPADTIPFILLRHASAGSKRTWSGEDLDRPLDARGAADAERLARLLSCFGPCRVISSAAERCVATVRPYAVLTGAAIEIDTDLTVRQAGGVSPDQLKHARQVVDDGQPAIICAHGENMQPLLQAICSRLGAETPAGPPLQKAAWWVLHAAGGTLAGAECYRPGDA